MDPVAAAATNATPVGDVRTKVTHEIDARLDKLKALEKLVHGNSALSDKERAALEAELRHDSDGLTALRKKVGTETTVDALQSAEHSMMADYRVFKVETPKIELAAQFAATPGTSTSSRPSCTTRRRTGHRPTSPRPKRRSTPPRPRSPVRTRRCSHSARRTTRPRMFDKLRAALHTANTSLDAAAGFITKA